MYKRILVPLDGSGLSESVLSHVKTMATACGPAEVHLLYVVEPLSAMRESSFSTQDKDYFAQSDRKAEAWGKDYLAKVVLNLETDSIKAKSIVLIGNPAQDILDYATTNAIDLIIMSTHGRSGLARWVFGSVAEKVIRTATCPVMIVRPAV